MNKQPILYVEDEECDVIFMRHAWKKAGLENPLHVVTDGEQAVAYLSGEGKYSNRREYPVPGLVLLDLKLPKLSGLGVLKSVREQPRTHLLPVMVLSSSNKPQDICAAYELRASAYLIKPVHIEDLSRLLGCMKAFWIEYVEPPPDCPVAD